MFFMVFFETDCEVRLVFVSHGLVFVLYTILGNVIIKLFFTVSAGRFAPFSHYVL